MNTVSRYTLLSLLVIFLLACGAPVPLLATQTPQPTAAPSITPASYPVTVGEIVTIVAVTDLNIREAACLDCDILRTVPAGTSMYAVCYESGWCYWNGGYFCRAASEGWGGCEVSQE